MAPRLQMWTLRPRVRPRFAANLAAQSQRAARGRGGGGRGLRDAGLRRPPTADAHLHAAERPLGRAGRVPERRRQAAAVGAARGLRHLGEPARRRRGRAAADRALGRRRGDREVDARGAGPVRAAAGARGRRVLPCGRHQPERLPRLRVPVPGAGSAARLAGAGALALTLALLLASQFPRAAPRSWAVDTIDYHSFPIKGAQLLAEGNWPGPLYNDYNWGGYLIWSLYPARKVFID